MSTIFIAEVRAYRLLTCFILGNVKQVLSIILAVIIFKLNITITNAAGILLTLIGGGWYT